VQEEPAAVADRISPTNLGLLFNARQVAVEFGYLTVPEMAESTQRTLTTVDRLAKHRGHLLNWYDTRTLVPLAPEFVSSVDSGNLLASLWTLEQGCLDRLHKPLLERSLAQGFLDHLCTLADWGALPQREFARIERSLDGDEWLQALLAIPDSLFDEMESRATSKKADDIRWLCRNASSRLATIRQLVHGYAPWRLPEFVPLRNEKFFGDRLPREVSLQQLADLRWEMNAANDGAAEASSESRALYERLKPQLAQTRDNALRLCDELRDCSARAGKLANEMDFSFLLDPRRELMSVGFDVTADKLQPACYDLLATESRTAVFTAIAKEDVPQECWFRLGRAHTLDQGHPVLMSWTGTMFEYLMPALWMRSYANTLLDRTQIAVVCSQRAYAAKRGVPWGISESAYFKLDETGNYQYRAFGLPHLALMRQAAKTLVISPYSTFLALEVDRSAALANLRRMDELGWFGSFGFYESADYTSSRSRFRRRHCEVVRCWMVHHQGMSLLALANLLCDRAVQCWFHNDRRVQATELLLHEKPVARAKAASIPYGEAAA
jgi:cyclic beta-1,2-glucan synthetase